MRKIKQTNRPFIISYVKGDRRLGDCARTLETAKGRIAHRLQKRHNRGEIGEVYFRGELVFSTAQSQQ